MTQPRTFASVDDLLDDARSRLMRVGPRQAADEMRAGAGLVDIRPVWQRECAGEIPGALVVERNHLEWRLHPASESRLPAADEFARWLVICAEGYTSSLAADALRTLGVDATDVIGGFGAWAACGLPTKASVTPPDRFVV